VVGAAGTAWTLENSEVLPSAFVAVALITIPLRTPVSDTLKLALPASSVVMLPERR
jgi:hypothetical protein